MMVILLAYLVLILPLPLLAEAAQSVPPERREVTGSIGLNKFDLFNQYLGTASGGDGSAAYRRVTQAMARKALADARDAGVLYFRISATGYAPAAYGQRGDLDLWMRDSAAYWALFDRMMTDLQSSGMQVIPTFVWNATQLPAMTGETVPQLLRDPSSRSFLLLQRYLREFIERYRGHPALLFYELTNEMNLGADIDIVTRCQAEKAPSLCKPKGNYTTADMIAFTERLTSLIRSLDPSRPISSGFSIPRAAAQRLRQAPEWTTKKTDWTPDSREQFEKNLKDIHAAVDIVSIHLNDGEKNMRFGSSDAIDLLVEAKKVADAVGKPLFVGEFGDQKPDRADAGSYIPRMIDKVAELRVPYSAIWVWEFYQKQTYLTRNTQPSTYSLEPGYTDYLIGRLREANSVIKGAALSSAGKMDTVAPRVVLTFPLECAVVTKREEVYAVASDDRGHVQRIEFWMGEKLLATDTAPPFQATLDPGMVKAGEYTLIARAFDQAGNSSDFASVILVHMKPGTGTICKTD